MFKIRSLIIGFLLLFGFNGVYGAISFHSDTLKSDLTLNSGDTIVLTDTVVVASGVTLTVNSGAVVQASADIVLEINGNLDVNGIVGNTAKFIPQSNETWSGIVINNGGKAAITGAFIDSAFYGIHIQSDSVNISLSEISNCERYGIYSEGNLIIDSSNIHHNTIMGIYHNSSNDTLTVSNSLICNNNINGSVMSGIYVYNGRFRITNNTIVNNGNYGVRTRYASSADTVKNCIITGHNVGIYCEYNYSCQSVNNNAWNNSSSNTHWTINTETISENPLFVSSSNFNITHRSPSRKLGYGGTYQGAFDWVGAMTTTNCGYLWENTTFSEDQTIEGDLVIPEGITLTLEEGVTLSFSANSDSMTSGAVDSLSELRIYGILNSNGTSASPVVLTSNDTAGTWCGVTIYSTTAMLSNLNISKAVYGVWAQIDGSTIKNSEISNCSKYGIYGQASITIDSSYIHDNYSMGILYNSSGDLLSISNSLISNNNRASTTTYGIYVIEGRLKSINNTICNNGDYGLHMRYSRSEDTVKNCIATDNSYGIYSNSGAIPSINNNSWNNSIENYTQVTNTGSISENPLFVSSTDYNLTHRSPSRKMGEGGTYQGCYSWGGAISSINCGYIWEDTTFTENQNIIGDLTVAEGVTLTLMPGIDLIFPANSDAMNSGTTDTLSELRVYGNLVSNATSTEPVVIKSDGATAGTWDGIKVYSGALNLNDLKISNAIYGVQFNNDGSSISNCEISNCSRSGIYSGGSLMIDRLKIFGNNEYGIYHNDTDIRLTVTNSVIFNNGFDDAVTGRGIYVYRGRLTAVNNTIVNNSGIGISLYGTSTADTIKNCIVTDHEYMMNGNSSCLRLNNNVWNCGGALGANSISENPLFVSSTDYNITHRSPSRKSGVDGTYQGAYDWAGAMTQSNCGYLWEDTTFSGNQTITGDLVIPEGITLTLNAGAILNFSSNSDLMKSGTTDTLSELRVYGDIISNGISSSPVILRSSDGVAGSWNGVKLYNSASMLRNLTVNDAIYGMWFIDDGSTVSNCEISNSLDYGIFCEGNLNVDSVVITMNYKSGIYFDSYTDTLTITNSLICNNNVGDTTSFGIYLYGRVQAFNNTIADNGDYGLYIRYPRSIDTIKNCIIASHDNGLYGESSYYGRCQSVNNNVWNNSIENTFNTIDSNLISENPLFVSSTDYNITHRSPSRMLGYGGTYQGAYPWAGAISSINCGYIWEDTVFSGSQTVVGDLTITDGVTLTLTPGTVMTFSANSDVMKADTIDTLSGLRVNGNLIADGTRFMKITLTSNDISAGNWEGVLVSSNGNTTLDNVILSNAVNGVWLESSVTGITNSEISNCSEYGIYCNGALTVNNSEIHDNYGNGIFQNGYYDNVIVTNSLIYNNNKSNENGYAIQSYGTLKAANNTVVNNGRYGISCSGSTDTVMNCIVTGHTYGMNGNFKDIHNNVWDNDTAYRYDIELVGSISENPLFVSSSDFNLTHRSPGRKMGFEGAHQGALTWAGAMTPTNQGYIWEDTVFSGNQSIAGNLIVPDSITLTLTPGAILTFASNSGFDVYGELIANGSRTEPITFTSNDTSVGSWDGITIFSDSTKLDYIKISNAVYGVFNRAEDFFITNSEIMNCSEYGVLNYADLTISSSKIYNNRMGGIYQDSTNRMLDISSCVVYDNGHGNPYGFGIYVFDGLIKSINNTVVDNCHYGIYMRGTYSYYIVNNCIVTENRYGIYVMVTVNGEPRGYNNNVWNNSTENVYGFINENPLNEDPLFVNRDHNIFNLLPNSPCVDAGYYGYGFPSADADGYPRPAPGIPGGDATIDIGAFEFTLDANRHPIPNPGSDTAVVIGETVFLSGATSTDADGNITTYEWDFGDSTIGIGETVSHTYNSNGNYTVTLKVTDNDGLFNYATKNVHVNTRPVAMAGLDKYADLGEDVYFDATGSTDSDGSVVDWKWYFGDGDSSLSSQVYHQYTFPGVYKAVTIVTDDDGADDSDTVIVTVYGATPVAPVIVSADRLDVEPGVEASYIASAIDANGEIPIISFHNIPSWMTVTGSEIKGTPGNDDGDTSFTVIASDGTLSDTLIVGVYIKTISGTLDIILKAGWNMISFNVIADDMSTSTIMSDIDSLVIVKDEQGNSFVPGLIDAIDTLKATEGYYLYTSIADTISITGEQVNASGIILNLDVGWNLIPYLPESQSSIETEIASIADITEIVKDDKGNSYIPTHNINSIGNMQPGAGYKIYLNEAVQFTYPGN